LIRSAREHIDTASGGSFFTLSIEETHKIIEKITSNQSWDEERTQARTCKVHHLEEVDMLTTKIDLLMKLENPGLDHLKMVNARVTCEECGEIGHMGFNCLMVYHDANFVGQSNNDFHLNKGFNSRWNKPSFWLDNHQQGGNGKIFNRNEPQLRDIIRDHLRINDEFGKNINATDKLLENISAKMDNFTVATQNQLSFNKMLVTQIQQIVAALPHQSNGQPSQSSVQESAKSIFTVFKGKTPNSTGVSLGGLGPGNAMTPDKEPSGAENFSVKSTRRVKDATPTTTSSPVTPAT
jgi:DNA polymerase III gamma/tau subunit